ncbi:MAG: hypothetical protein WCT20_00180 [Candidatus Babeliales bacterium]
MHTTLSTRVYDFLHSYLQRYLFKQADTKKDLDIGIENGTKKYVLDERQLMLVVPGPTSVVYEAYIIAMIDQLTREALAIEESTLAINYVGCGNLCCAKNLCQDCSAQSELLKETLALLAVTYRIDPTLTFDGMVGPVFALASRQLEGDHIFCTGGQNAHGFGAQCDCSKLLALVGKSMPILKPLAISAISVIVPLSSDQHQLAVLLAHYLQNKGCCVDVNFSDENMKETEAFQVRSLLFLGSKEQAQNTTVVKNLLTSQSHIVGHTEIAERLR